jgi:NTE family protein
MAYHAGALKALEETGVDLGGSDIIIGTSAGSVMASYIGGAGWTGDDFFQYAHGRHPDVAKDPDDDREAVRQIFEPLWTSGSERVRRSIGSFFALASSRGHWHRASRGKMPFAYLRHMFPAGLYSTQRTRERLHEDLPAEWPREGLYICAADLYTGKLVPFGRAGAPESPLPDAVLASCAIPGVFPPVRISGRQCVDGGAVSATSLDLAVEDGAKSIICIAPLGYRNEGSVFVPDPHAWAPMLTRSFFARPLRREVHDAREKGVEVLVIRPWINELKDLGTNAMRHFDRGAVSNAAREGTLRLLEQQADHPALAAARTDNTARPEPESDTA